VAFSKGLLDFSKCEYKHAITSFEKVIELDTAAAADPAKALSMIGSETGVGVVAASNNLAICALYCCALKRAVSCLEGLLRQSPQKHMQDVILFNLCTLYDLACDNTTSTLKKRVLQHMGSRYHLDHINPASFRIPNQ
jgi:hypothetical protein